MERQLARLASFSPRAGVIIRCTAQSPQAALVRTLNACAREGMANVSVFSM